MSFPTIVYKCPGIHQCPGSTYSYKGAADDAELGALLADGWCRTLPDALGGKLVEDAAEEPGDDFAPTREELEAKAEELGIKFDGRTTDAGLLRRIAAELDPESEQEPE